MPRQPVRVVPHGEWSTWELCSKTLQGAYLLRPDPFMSKVPLGLLARCLESFPGVRVHNPEFQSNHYHLLLSVRSAQERAGFMNLYNSLLARMVNLHLRRTDRVWRDTYGAMRVYPSKERSRGIYLMGQGLGEGLYARAHHNPCAQAVEALTQGKPLKGIDVDLAAWSQARKKDPTIGPEKFSREVTVPLTPLPSIAHLSPQQQQAWWRAVVRDAEEEGALKRAEAKITEVLGAEAMRAQNPFSRPKVTKRGKTAPLCCGNAEETAAHDEEYKAIMETRQVAHTKLAVQVPASGLPRSVHAPAALVCAARQLEPRCEAEKLPDG